MLESADTNVSADYAKRNHAYLTSEHLNYRAKEQEKLRKSYEKTENKEHKKADSDLENELFGLKMIDNNNLKDFIDENYFKNDEILDIAKRYLERQNSLGRNLAKTELKNHLDKEFENKVNISIEDRIKNYKKELIQQGKSQTEILQLLINKYENTDGVETLVNNFKSFLKLHQFAESKPLAERRAINKIIERADLSSSTAFTTSLSEISLSAEISQETKLEISREFGGAHIDSVDGMDYQLQQVKEHTKAIEQEIDIKSREKSFLDLEIDELEDELDTLPLDDPKRQELETKIEQKKEVLEQTENEIDRLETGKPKGLSFVLRQGFSARLNPDGSRSIRIDNEDFAIKLPSNFLPLTTTKNLRSINLTFPYLILKNQNIADSLFLPNLDNNSAPTKSQRDMGHLILSSLGIDDKRILSEENIKQLKKDLSALTPKNGKTGQENLVELGVFDVASQSLDKGKLKKVLELVRENRG